MLLGEIIASLRGNDFSAVALSGKNDFSAVLLREILTILWGNILRGNGGSVL